MLFNNSPIFIQGIRQRSGTNFLWRLLLNHPHCHPGSVGEDFLLKHAHFLSEYSQSLFNNWTDEWRARYKNGSDTVLAQLGESLIHLIKKPYDLYTSAESGQDLNPVAETADYLSRRLVTKTPNVDNLDLFFKLFPNAGLIVIVRDGRSVVASGMKSFGWDFETAARQWASAARKIIQFDEAERGKDKRYLIVKFEDLFTDFKGVLSKIFSVLGLDPELYDFAAAESMPVYGSSEIKSSQSSINWVPKPKTSDFKPLQRYAHWTEPMHRRFNWIAGNTMRKLNYPLEPTAKRTVVSAAMNIGSDLKHQASGQLQKLRRRISRLKH